MSGRYVLGFVSAHAYGILRWWTEKILQSFEKHGFSHHLIDLNEGGWQAKLDSCLSKGKPQFCFSFQGIGTDLRLPNGQNFWTSNAIPFFSYMGDNPYHAPRLHVAAGPGIYLLYGCADFLQTYADFLDGHAFASILPHHYPENPLANQTKWAQREHAIVYVKSGVNAEAMRKQWDQLPGKIRSILHETAAQVLSGRDETVAKLCAESFAHFQIHWGDRREFFFSACSMVDMYARAVRAERMVRALMPHDALIVGDWSHLDQSGAHARFFPPIEAQYLDKLYADSRIVVSTSATTRFGMHERVLAGLFAQAAVLSDTTPYLERVFQNCPAFLGVDIDAPTFSEQVSTTIESCLTDAAMPGKTQVSMSEAHKLFSFENFIQLLVDYADLERFRQALTIWNLQPLPGQPGQPAAA